MNQYSLYKILFFFIFSTIIVVAQNKSVGLKTIWENTKQPDSIRFKALADYYIQYNQAQPAATLKVLDYYYQLAKEKNNALELYNVANDRGGIYRLKGEADKAFKYYNEAQKFAEKLNDSILIATNLGNKGNVYASKRDYSKALHFFSNALKIFKKINNKKGESHMLTSIGNVYLYIKNFDFALAHYQKALSIIKNVEVPKRRIAVNYINIGETNYELKNYKESKIYYEKALKILELTNDKFFLVSCYSYLAKIHLELNEIERASYYAERNASLSYDLKMPSYIKEAQIIFAQIELKKGNFVTAKRKGESILAELDIITSNELKLNLYNLLYKVYQTENNSKKSLEMYQKYTIYKDSIELERNRLTLIREVIKNEFDDEQVKNEQKLNLEKAKIEAKQKRKTYVILLVSIILMLGIVFYFNRNLRNNRKRRDELLQEIDKLKLKVVNNLEINPVFENLKVNKVENRGVNQEIEGIKSNEVNNPEVNLEIEKHKRTEVNKLVIDANEFQLVRENIEKNINRKLNTTDWNVLNILLKEPDISNKEIAEKAFMSVDGIGSSLRRMYSYFEIKESKYKKISLIMEAIKASS